MADVMHIRDAYRMLIAGIFLLSETQRYRSRKQASKRVIVAPTKSSRSVWRNLRQKSDPRKIDTYTKTYRR
jgi:hypothetical protein